MYKTNCFQVYVLELLQNMYSNYDPAWHCQTAN